MQINDGARLDARVGADEGNAGICDGQVVRRRLGARRSWSLVGRPLVRLFFAPGQAKQDAAVGGPPRHAPVPRRRPQFLEPDGKVLLTTFNMAGVTTLSARRARPALLAPEDRRQPIAPEACRRHCQAKLARWASQPNPSPMLAPRSMTPKSANERDASACGARAGDRL